MATSLEDRRLAIAAALRAAMAEPPAAAPSLVETPPASAEPLQRRTLREALTAEIDWDEPEHVEALDDVESSPDDLSSLGDLDDDWVTPSVPPIEVAGSMSRVASLALFGHA